MIMFSTFKLKSVLVAGLCLFGLHANAQYSARITQDPTSDYSNVAASFKLTDVAATLGTDTATLVAALDTCYAHQYSDDAQKLFFHVTTDGTKEGGYTGNYGEFWLDHDGAVHAYSGAAVFVGSNWDVTKDVYNVYMGQMPNYFTKKDSVSTKVALVFNGKEATFDIKYVINELPANPFDRIAKNLEIVGEQTVNHHQMPRSNYAADAIKIAVPGLAAQLGLSDEKMQQLFKRTVFAPMYNETYGNLSDSLTDKTTSGNAPGFWMRRYQDNTGKLLPNNVAACAYGDSARVYAEAFTLNATGDTISFNLGQFPGKLHAADSVATNIYFVWGQKAYKLNLGLIIDKAASSSLKDMTMVGEENCTVEDFPLNTNYQTRTFKFDVKHIAELLGCDSTQLSLQGIDTNGELTSSSSANNGGYWMTKNGVVTSWGTGAAFWCEPVGMYDDTHPNLSSMNMGMYPSGIAVGDSLKGTLYITDPENTKYYKLNLLIVVVEAPKANALNIVATKKANIQVIKSSTDYLADNNQTKYYVKPDECNSIIGTASPELYSLYADSTWKSDGTHKYNKDEFVCSPAPGFWLGKQGQAHGWSNNDEAPVGICYDKSTGLFTIYQAPGAANTVGTSYKTSLFLVNEASSNAIEIDFTINWVDKLETVQEVGNMSVTLPVSTDDAATPVDLTAAAKALGLSSVKDLLEGGYYLKGKKDDGTYTEGVDAINGGVTFTDEGAAQAQDGNIGLTFALDDNGAATANTYANNELPQPFKTNATVCFQVDTKRYVVYITFVDPETFATGINNTVATAKTNGKVYDLSGRQVSKPAHGIYIKNGKKILVK